MGAPPPTPRDLTPHADPGSQRQNLPRAQRPRSGLGPEVSAQVPSLESPILCSGRDQFSGTALALACLAVPSNLVVVGREI